MKNHINFDIFLVDNGKGIENTYSLSFETPLGMMENIHFRASNDNVISKALKCLGDNLSIVAECRTSNH